MAKLTGKQRLFVEAYLETLNATEAARRAGYKAKTDEAFRAIGSENLTKLNIKEQIDARMKEAAMSAEEVLLRFTQQARVDISDYLNEYGMIDRTKIRRAGHLVKSIRETRDGVQIVLHDAQHALEVLAKYHRLLTEVHEVNLSGPAILLDK